MKLGVYVGCFNPPHKGHIAVVNYCLEKGAVDKVIIVPGQAYWNKTNLVSMHHRLNMLSFFKSDKILIDEVHNKLEYTYEVLNAIKCENESDEVYFIIGSDILKTLYLWKNVDEILNYKIIVLKRKGNDINGELKRYSNGQFIILDDFKMIPASSSEIRKNLNSRYLDSRVRNYIRENKLYESE